VALRAADHRRPRPLRRRGVPVCDAADGKALLEHLRGATPGEQTCSAGLVVWDGAQSAERLFGSADKALYAAKEAGRDRIVVAG
jgi:GGDEF domain-containing protein